MKVFLRNKKSLLSLIVCMVILTFAVPALAATTEIHIVKYANDGKTVLSEKTLTYQQMRDTLPVMGDGTTHYYHQGPVFVDNPNEAVNKHSVGTLMRMPMLKKKTWVRSRVQTSRISVT